MVNDIDKAPLKNAIIFLLAIHQDNWDAAKILMHHQQIIQHISALKTEYGYLIPLSPDIGRQLGKTHQHINEALQWPTIRVNELPDREELLWFGIRTLAELSFGPKNNKTPPSHPLSNKGFLACFQNKMDNTTPPSPA